MSNDLIWIIILSVVAVGLFGWLWRAGHLVRFANYIRETKEELRKCSWPTWEELKDSTIVVSVAIFLLGGFTVAVDAIFLNLYSLLNV